MKSRSSLWTNIIANFNDIVCFWVIDKKIKLSVLRKHLRIVLGAGMSRQTGWLSTDKKHLNMLVIEDWQRYFKENSIDAMFAEHVWEHLTEEDAITAAKNCYAYLKQDGYLRVAVPDGLHPSREYLDAVKPMGSGPGAYDHKVLYTYISLSAVFKLAGFDVELLEYFDESGKFHHKDWNYEAGFVSRSMGFDVRNRDGSLNYTSIILDAWKRDE